MDVSLSEAAVSFEMLATPSLRDLEQANQSAIA